MVTTILEEDAVSSAGAFWTLTRAMSSLMSRLISQPDSSERDLNTPYGIQSPALMPFKSLRLTTLSLLTEMARRAVTSVGSFSSSLKILKSYRRSLRMMVCPGWSMVRSTRVAEGAAAIISARLFISSLYF